MVRRAHAIDGNQPEIVAALRAFGYQVQSLAGLGGGVPDLLVSRAGVNILLEIKDGAKSPSAQRLTEPEARWHQTWRGQVAVARSADEALLICGTVLSNSHHSDCGRPLCIAGCRCACHRAQP